MNIVELAVKRWQITLVLFLLAALLGANAVLNIPRSVDPHFSIPSAFVIVQLPGADAGEIEETIVKPIETVLRGLDNVREVLSFNNDGSGVIFVAFNYGMDSEQALDRVVREVNAIRGGLPANGGNISFRRPRTTDAAVLQLAMTGNDASWLRIDKYASDLRDRLNAVPGVRATQIAGLAEPEMRVALDPGKLAELKLPPTLVAQAVAEGGTDLPSGSVEAGDRRFNVKAGGAYRTAEELADILVRANDGRTVRIGDVATVGWSEAEQLHVTRLNGTRAVFISVKQQDGVDAVGLRDDLAQAITSFRTALPPDILLETVFDQSRDIETHLGRLATDFAIALALVLVTLLPLGLRASMVVMISIPLSLAIGVLVLFLLGYSLNQISITGFIISLGLLVDDSIVVTENIERHGRNGKSAERAAIEGTREVSLAVLGSTSVLVLAFLPIANLPQTTGDFVRGLPVAVLATVTASLLVSLTIVPFVASKFLKPQQTEGGNRFLLVLMTGIERLYRPALRRALDSPRTTVWSTLAVCTLMLCAIPLIGFSLFPKADQAYFMIQIEAPEGSSVMATDKIVTEVSSLLANLQNVTARIENAGRGNPQIFYNYNQQEFDTRYGEIFVTLNKFDPGATPKFVADVRSRLNRFPGARISVLQFDSGPPIEAPLALRVIGPEFSQIKRISAQVADIFRSTPGTSNVIDPLASDKIDLDLGIDYPKAALLDVSAGAIRKTVRLALAGETVASFRDSEGDSYPVRVRLPLDRAQPVSALRTIHVPSLAGASVPLAQITSPRFKSVPARISRYDLERANTVSASVLDGQLPSRILPQIMKRVQALRLPDGYSVLIGGEAMVLARSTTGISGIVLLAVFGILGVLVAEFGRFRDVAVVAGVIPLGFFGGLLALLITGYSLSFLAVIGFIALIGIEIKNSILLVDFTNHLRKSGMDLRSAVEKAGEIRFVPVLLTSVTAIGGLLPLAWSGAPLYAPLACVIIGGLVSSTLLSRVVTPAMYLLVARGASAARAQVESGLVAGRAADAVPHHK